MTAAATERWSLPRFVLLDLYSFRAAPLRWSCAGVADKLSPETRADLVRLGEHIRLTRRARGYSRRSLAEAIGMHVGNYARIERGTKNVTYDTLLRIAKGLQVDLVVALRLRRRKRRANKGAQNAST